LNVAELDQAATQLAGVGGAGGNQNSALGGAVGFHGPIGGDAITTGSNAAGEGGDGRFMGTMVDASAAAFSPINSAAAGSHEASGATRLNTVHVDQSAVQIAGTGGNGGTGNVAIGGDISQFATGQGLGHDQIGSDVIVTGGNSAGNGGDGYFNGSVVHQSFAFYEPINIAVAGVNSSPHADQTNSVDFAQSAFQIAGVGGQGGDGNIAAGGNVDSVSLGSGPVGSDVIATGGNSAGSGGDGYFVGSMVYESFSVYDPINIAVAGANSSAHADQINNVDFNQSAFQMVGVGGHGGDGNVAAGGNVGSVSLGSGPFGSDAIVTGGNSAGTGGEGYFSGSVVHESFALYDPINIAIAGPGGSAQALQTNNADFNQSSFQMAGVGGHGGDGNVASGGNAAIVSSNLGAFGSDVIATGGNSGGDGGNGHFSGALVDLNVAIYAPINIAVAGYNSSATADQINTVHFDQSAIQIAGVGGDGGHGNLALGGDFAMQLLADPHLSGHAA
jgi:hypothetical protein